MKRIGLLGGMSWESTVEYYRLLNEEVRDRLGGLHSADCVLGTPHDSQTPSGGRRSPLTGGWGSHEL